MVFDEAGAAAGTSGSRFLGDGRRLKGPACLVSSF